MKNVKEYADKHTITSFFRELQDSITQNIEHCDGKSFKEDFWVRNGGGGGRTRVLTDGNIIEKGGVNFSEVFGMLSPTASEALQVEKNQQFFASGVSVVLHPKSPMIPIIHMNVRYFELSGGTKWFGGGIDLTPIYINTSDAAFFHQELKTVCDRHHPSYYPEFKKLADNYFYIKHRNETRGVGGIFFDKVMPSSEVSSDQLFAFSKDIGLAFSPIYLQLINNNKEIPYGEKQRQWQLVRRGRYVEFNLIYDRGTKFGLDTNGRIESIFMSLPPEVNWPYNFQIEPNSQEEYTQSLLQKGIDWVK
ncbi:Coproporphyrinogen-III oxidase, aerobic [Bacillus sp. THAF10]|uniref:oxygen-dependent coproporphyrinogen oxidase n=1 Tax=Bacillus sp. THAF10 TaxID=2587848 RepID=UPI0012681C92|nr:oxygen-dependent coproporphyrinogen oxidase [Bacillus sp. THAF10]QFT87751.1 Coproporphyrinogen-III oxidase, aerobic [Bacillus sp. THAF10]